MVLRRDLDAAAGDAPMATEAQIAANRKNAARSTGPKTEKGKDKARRNALKHGGRAGTLDVMPVLPHEDPRALQERTAAWLDDWQSADGTADVLARRGGLLAWKLERADRAEVAYLATASTTPPSGTRPGPWRRPRSWGGGCTPMAARACSPPCPSPPGPTPRACWSPGSRRPQPAAAGSSTIGAPPDPPGPSRPVAARRRVPLLPAAGQARVRGRPGPGDQRPALGAGRDQPGGAGRLLPAVLPRPVVVARPGVQVDHRVVRWPRVRRTISRPRRSWAG